MTRILLATTALVTFAGAAAADGHVGISFSGSAELGYNDTAYSTSKGVDDNDANPLVTTTAIAMDTAASGFYSDLDITANLLVELDNGLTAAASMNLDDFVASGGSNNGKDYELSLTNETAGLYYGDTNFAAQNVWASAGDMESDGFSEADGEEVLRGEVAFGAVSTQISYAIGTRVAGASDLEQLSVGASADFGNVNVVFAYQESASAAYAASRGAVDVDGDGVNGVNAANGDFNANEVFGLSVGTSFAGADVRLAYADNGTTDSIGVKASYPVGPVTATAYYVAESAGGDNWGLNLAYADGPVLVTADYQDDQGTADWGIEGSFDAGNGIMVFAGIDDSGDDYYVGGTYDLGSGASLLMSYADDSDSDESADDDDIGAQDYKVGTTVEISFTF